MRFELATVILCALSGCGGWYQRRMAEIDAEKASEREEEARAEAEAPAPAHVAIVIAEYAPLMVAPRCKNGVQAGAEPTSIRGVHFEQRCGLVTADASTESLAKYAQASCGGGPFETCLTGYLTMYLARVTERYPYADARWIDNHCTGYPDDCASLGRVELLHMNSHNQAVSEAWKAKTKLVVAQAEIEAAERRQAFARSIGRTFQQAGAAFQPSRTTNCTSTGYGGVVNSSCTTF